MANRTTTRCGGNPNAALLSLRLGWALAMTAFPAANARVMFFQANVETPVAIPDNSAVGTVHTLTVDGFSDPIASIEVQLNIRSRGGGFMYNGDLYLTLAHNGNSAVLLNRVGRREGFSAGYGDAGFNITLSDSAPADIHSYRVTLNGSDLVPLSSGDVPGILTGTWQPDARAVDPQSVFTSSPRIASLSQLYGATANGTWSLFMADLSPEGLAELTGWSLRLVPVPEPTRFAAVVGVLLGFWVFARRRLG